MPIMPDARRVVHHIAHSTRHSGRTIFAPAISDHLKLSVTTLTNQACEKITSLTVLAGPSRFLCQGFGKVGAKFRIRGLNPTGPKPATNHRDQTIRPIGHSHQPDFIYVGRGFELAFAPPTEIRSLVGGLVFESTQKHLPFTFKPFLEK